MKDPSGTNQKLIKEISILKQRIQELEQLESERKRAESKIQAMARFPSENPNPILRIARDGTLLYANEACSSLLPDWHLQVGRGVPSMVRDIASQALTSGKTLLHDLEHRGRVYSFFVVPIADADYANMYGSDITARKRAEEELRLSEERFKRIFEEGPIGMVLVNLNREIVTANEALCRLLGYSAQELVGRNMTDLTYEEDSEKNLSLAIQLSTDNIPRAQLEKRYVKKDGGIVWTKVTAAAIHSKEGRAIYNLGIIEDLTESKKAAEKIHVLAYYDSLTGLPNRTFHKELMMRAIDHANRRKEFFATIYIGLDNFQRINDIYGHSKGDLLLKAVADRLANSLRKSDYVASSYEAETT